MPSFHGCWIPGRPFRIYFIQLSDGGFFVQSGIDGPKISGKIIHVLIGYICKGITYYMCTMQRWDSVFGNAVAISSLSLVSPSEL
jgi:hypothetical protein